MDRESVSRHDLDNRKLVLTFIVLIILLGVCFGLGYRAGKHQGYEDGRQVAMESALKTNSMTMPANTNAPSNAATTETPLKDEGVDPKLTWYKNVNRPDGELEAITPPAETTATAPKEAVPPVTMEAKEPPPESPRKTAQKIAKEIADKVIPQAKAASADKVTYTVQVGAFKARREVETKAKELRAEGFDIRIEVPDSPEGLYLLKVGKFSSRADATAMQLKLQKSGFASFIKID
jgi:cell division protein FtsN